MKHLFESFKIAFSMYSKIPMPNSEWTEDNMSHAMCFFPCVGLVIGGLSWGIYQLAKITAAVGFTFVPLFWAGILTVIPILVTGGIHMDGFLDTMDALSSWQSQEKRLEILKDPHAGAFAIISAGVYLLLSLAAYSAVETESIGVIALGFILSRSLSGISVVTFPQARKKGLVATFAEKAAKKTVRNVLACYTILLLAAMAYVGGLSGILAWMSSLAVFGYYYHMSRKQFGGVTGDLAGYFLQICELAILWTAVVSEQVIMFIK